MRFQTLLFVSLFFFAVRAEGEKSPRTPAPATPTPYVQAAWGSPAPTPLPTVPPEGVRRAYMNCLLEVDTTAESLTLNRTARKAEAEAKLSFCENRKKDCTAHKDGPDCRTFVEEFAEAGNRDE